MEHGALNEELGRFLIAVSAAEEARLNINLIDGPLPEGQRQYLYSTPNDGGRFRNDHLDRQLAIDETPYLVNWDRESVFFGLRYVQSSERLSKALEVYAGVEAKKDWQSWRDEKIRQDDVLSRAASYALRGSALSFLDDGDTEILDKRVSRRSDLEI